MKRYLFIISFLLFSFPLISLAMPGDSNAITSPGDSGQSCGANEVCLNNPLPGITSPQKLIGKIIDAVLGVVGSLALVMFVYGGITWMTSSGSPEKVKKGRDILIWSAIGLVIIFSSYALVTFVITRIAS